MDQLRKQTEANLDNDDDSNDGDDNDHDDNNDGGDDNEDDYENGDDNANMLLIIEQFFDQKYGIGKWSIWSNDDRN